MQNGNLMLSVRIPGVKVTHRKVCTSLFNRAYLADCIYDSGLPGKGLNGNVTISKTKTQIKY